MLYCISCFCDRTSGLHILKAEEFIWDHGFQEYNSPCQMYSFPVELAPPPPPTHTYILLQVLVGQEAGVNPEREQSMISKPNLTSQNSTHRPEFKLMSLWES